MTRWYWCDRCEVLGSGDACWSCDRSDKLTRDGPKVDAQVYAVEPT